MSGIQKIYMEFSTTNSDGALHYQIESLHGRPIEQMELPFDENDTSLTKMKMQIYADGKASNEIDLDMFHYLKDGPQDFSDNEVNDLEKRKNDDPILKNLTKDFFVLDKYKGTPNASMSYADVTERDLLGELPINAQHLTVSEGGVWAFSGLRKLEFTVENMFASQNVDVDSMGALYWNQIDNQPMTPLFEDSSVYEDLSARKERDPSKGQARQNTFAVYCNTNNLGELLADQESVSPIFLGRFEVHYKYNSDNNSIKESWGFPVSLCVQNVIKNPKLRVDRRVSIDFGTSTSCAAVREGGLSTLLTISGPEKRISKENEDKRYENPTNIMIYDWDELRRQWNANNPGMPFLTVPRPGISEEDCDYDSGYTVEEIFKDVDDLDGRKKVRAIVTDIKNVPSTLAANYEKKIIPYDTTSKKIIFITDSLEKEDDNHFNPIKFYGYLLGRAINNPAKSHFYTRYLVSYPVGFEEPIKESLRKSLAAGILRSLPTPIRESLNPDTVVEMKYSEPVASVAALIPTQLRLDEAQEPTMFAIFDLGGGTLDTAFGILRKARGEETDDAESTIQIFGIGGDDVSGGERLIHQLAFKIYTDNYDIMRQNNIPFIKPNRVSLPPNMNEYLLERHDEISESNVHTIIEKLARPLFCYPGPITNELEDVFPKYKEGKDVEGDEVKLTMITADNQDKEVKLKITGVDDFLKETISRIVKDFSAELKEKFLNNSEELIKARLPEDEEISESELQNALRSFDPDLSKVKIFLGGNASKQKFVHEVMEEMFPGQWEEIGNPKNSTAKEKHASERITAKTAVAFGQLSIGNFVLDMSSISLGVSDSGEKLVPFQYNVGYKDTNTGEFIKVIEKGSTSTEWKEANHLNQDDETELYYTKQYDPDNENLKDLVEQVTVEDTKKRRLFLRVSRQGDNCLEYRLCRKGQPPEATEEPDPDKVLRLS